MSEREWLLAEQLLLRIEETMLRLEAVLLRIEAREIIKDQPVVRSTAGTDQELGKGK